MIKMLVKYYDLNRLRVLNFCELALCTDKCITCGYMCKSFNIGMMTWGLRLATHLTRNDSCERGQREKYHSTSVSIYDAGIFSINKHAKNILISVILMNSTYMYNRINSYNALLVKKLSFIIFSQSSEQILFTCIW